MGVGSGAVDAILGWENGGRWSRYLALYSGGNDSYAGINLQLSRYLDGGGPGDDEVAADSCGGGVMKIGRSRKAVIASTQGRLIISLKSSDNQSKHH